MSTVNASDARIAGQTSDVSVAAFNFEAFTFTAPAFKRSLDWLVAGQPVSDRSSHHPLAQGDGHRP